MLIEFNVTNFKSIKEKQTLSMAAIDKLKDSDEIEQIDAGRRVLTTPNSKLPNLLATAVLYGANASGKSKLIDALAFMEYFVVRSQQHMQSGEPIEVTPFLFDQESAKAPSEFEVLFIHNNVRYQYGFAVTKERVHKEWLLAYPCEKVQNWFYREYDNDTQKYTWKFGAKFKGAKKILEYATRDNGLFLAAAVQLNNEQLRPIFEWFQKGLLIIGQTYNMPDIFTFEQCLANEDSKRAVLEMIKCADPSVCDIEVEKIDPTKKEWFNRLPLEKREKLLDKYKVFFVPETKFVHMDKQGAPVELDFDDESEGTKNLFSFIAPMREVLEDGKILIIDELNNSLHPLLVRKLIEFFHNPEINKNNAQLIFSTHDASLLDKTLFRRDQIWFTEKNQENATTLYSLSDFKVRKEEAIGKGYLQGRYGAIPCFGGDS